MRSAKRKVSSVRASLASDDDTAAASGRIVRTQLSDVRRPSYRGRAREVVRRRRDILLGWDDGRAGEITVEAIGLKKSSRAWQTIYFAPCIRALR